MWEEVLNRALLGTEKQPFAIPEAPVGVLGELLARLDTTDGEGALLRTAGVLAVYRRAGVMPGEDGVELTPDAGEEVLALPSARAAQLLERMLSGMERDLFPVWLELAARTGRRIPVQCLVGSLEAGRQSKELRELIRPVLGKRGQWLAAQNPDWNYLSGDTEDERTWDEGTLAGRSAYLKRVRKTDPARGRELLEEVWKSEPARERTEFVGRLQIGLSMEDEPFLEQALDDRGKEVRTAAAELLARLPGSGLVRRMEARLKELVRVEKKLLRGAKLAVEPPEKVDAAMKRDGIQEKGAFGFGMGEKAAILYQIVRAVPPSWWQRELELSPSELLPLAEKSDWTVPLVMGWRDGAAAAHDREWINAMLEYGKGEVLKHAHHKRELLMALPPDERRAWVIRQMETGKLDEPYALLELPGPWDLELSRTALETVVGRMVKKPGGWSYVWKDWLRELSCKLASETLPEAEAMVAQVKPEGGVVEKYLTDFLESFRFRYEIVRELGE